MINGKLKIENEKTFSVILSVRQLADVSKERKIKYSFIMNKPTTPNAHYQPIIFFDGYCNLCNRSVDWVMRKDKKQVFQFASLQGKTAAELLGNQLEGLDSVVLYSDGKVYSHYQAVGLICKQLPFPYSLGLGFYILPDFIYNWIARNRYRWFGKRETCRLPTEEEKARFLG